MHYGLDGFVLILYRNIELLSSGSVTISPSAEMNSPYRRARN